VVLLLLVVEDPPAPLDELVDVVVAVVVVPVVVVPVVVVPVVVVPVLDVVLWAPPAPEVVPPVVLVSTVLPQSIPAPAASAADAASTTALATPRMGSIVDAGAGPAPAPQNGQAEPSRTWRRQLGQGSKIVMKIPRPEYGPRAPTE
jgi:hypothetical protein